MFTLGHRGQLTIYISEDVGDLLMKFADEYPIASASDILNASLRYYLPAALKGADGRLQPLKREEVKTVGELLEEFKLQRRVAWTEEQRRKALKNKGAPKSPQTEKE